MYHDAYEEWVEIFTDDLLEIWQRERKELQKAAMLLNALQKEFKKIERTAEVELENIRQKLKSKDSLVELKNSYSIGKKTPPDVINKENEFDENLEVFSSPKENKSKIVESESPDLFKNIDLNVEHCIGENSTYIEVINSDDSNEGRSPTIKRRKKFYDRRKLVSTKGSTSRLNDNVNSEMFQNTPENIIPANHPVKVNLFRTPNIDLDHDLSIIDNTPDIPVKNTKNAGKVRQSLTNKKKKNTKVENTTLTQMFGRSQWKSKKRNSKIEECVDPDETSLEDTKVSEMGITELLDFINKDESIKVENQPSLVHRGDDDSTYFDVEIDSSQEIDKFSKAAIFNETDISSSSEKPKVPKVPSPQAEPVVRGKARMQLQGWACEQCKNFYGTMNLSPEALKKQIDACSRHRYKYRPPEETMPGFWDLDIPPEKS